MKIQTKVILTAALLAAGTLGTVTAFAATSGSATSGATASGTAASAPAAGHRAGQGLHRGPGLAAAGAEVAKVLGIDEAALKADLKAGQTLAQIAQSKGIDEQTLISDLQSALRQKLDQAVQSGKLTADQEQQLLQKFAANAKQLVERKWPQPKAAHPGGLGGPARGLLQDAAQILGVDAQTLKSDLQSGQSLAQVAESKGVSVDSLVSQLAAKAKAHLDQAVQSGKLSADKEQQMLSRLQQQLARAVQHAGPWGPPHGKGQGHQPPAGSNHAAGAAGSGAGSVDSSGSDNSTGSGGSSGGASGSADSAASPV